MTRTIWKNIGIKLQTKADVEIACNFLRISQYELVEYMLEALSLVDMKIYPNGKKNPFLNGDYLLGYEKYKLSLTHSQKPYKSILTNVLNKKPLSE